MKKHYSIVLKIFLLLFIFIFAINLNTVQSQEKQLTYELLNIQLFPEFTSFPDKNIDNSTLLFNYHGIISNNSNMRYNEKIGIPVQLNNPNFKLTIIEEILENNHRKELKYLLDEKNQMLYIIPNRPIEANGKLEFIIEYYITPFDQLDKRVYTFSFYPYNDIQKLEFIVYPPLGSSYFELNPDGLYMESNKLESYYYLYDDVRAGDEKQISFSYIKQDETTTLDRLLQHSDNSNPDVDNLKKLNNNLMILLILVFSILFIYMLYQNRLNQKEIVTREIKELRKLYNDGEISEHEYIERRNSYLRRRKNSEKEH